MAFLKVKNAIKFDSEVTISNNLVITGTVDGRDVSVDGGVLDSHVADATLHRVINDAGTSATELWSASKISTELGTKANSSHTHVAADVTDFNTAADARITLQKGAANGLASLDGAGKVPSSQLPSIAITDVNVVANIAARNALTPNEGDVAKVTDAGSGYPQTYIYDGSAWVDIQESSDVISVNAQTGVVVLDTDDIGEGSTNLWYTEARVNANTNVAANTAHAALTSGNPHNVTKADVGLGNLTDIKSNDSATSAPAVSNDSTENYSVGSHWIDVTNDVAYICVDNSVGAAIWVSIGSASGGVTSVNSQTGVVVLDSDDIAEGSTNLYYTEARVNANANVSANSAHRVNTANPHSVTKTQVGLSEVENIKVNYTATTAPLVTDDTAGGYSVGSFWVNTTTDTAYICLDSTNGAAKWQKIIEDDDDYFCFKDDFIGSQLGLDWLQTTQGSSSEACQVDGFGGIVQLLSDSTTNDYCEMKLSYKFIDKAIVSSFSTRVKLSSVTEIKFEIGAMIDVNNIIRFIYNASGSGTNISTETISGGTSTLNDTLIAGSTNWVGLRIDLSNTEIKFYVDGVLKTTHTTNIPSGLMYMYSKNTSNSNAQRNTQIDYVKLEGLRN